MKKSTTTHALTKSPTVVEAHGLQKILLDLFFEIPDSDEKKRPDPRRASQAIARAAATKAASVSGTLALPPGPLGWATIFPDLVEVWRIQSQMVADIAAVHGKTAHMKKETLLFCLFRHGAAALTRDLVVRAGKQVIVRRLTRIAFQLAVRKVGGRLTRTVIEKTIARSIPLVGALAVGGFAYYDTSKVAATAIDLFSGEMVTEGVGPKKRNPGTTQRAVVAAVTTATSLKKKIATQSKELVAKAKKKVSGAARKKVVAMVKKEAKAKTKRLAANVGNKLVPSRETKAAAIGKKRVAATKKAKAKPVPDKASGTAGGRPRGR